MHAPEPKSPPLANAAAFGVHIFTASGAVLALFALLAAIEYAWAKMFFFLGAALFVDGVDGMLARRLDVAERLPRWSGDVLDLVVDFLTYVFIPAYVVVGERPAARIPRDPVRDRDHHFERALFRRHRDEDGRQLLPRLPGGVERAGVLFAAA